MQFCQKLGNFENQTVWIKAGILSFRLKQLSTGYNWWQSCYDKTGRSEAVHTNNICISSAWPSWNGRSVGQTHYGPIFTDFTDNEVRKCAAPTQQMSRRILLEVSGKQILIARMKRVGLPPIGHECMERVNTRLDGCSLAQTTMHYPKDVTKGSKTGI